LAPGESATFTGDDYVVTVLDMLDPAVVNTATASGTGVRGGGVTSAPSTARTPTTGPGGSGGDGGGGTSCDVGVDRVGGADRYATAALLSARTWSPGVPVVYVASGQNFPDALGGGVAAGHAGAPLLLVTRTGVPAATAHELTRLAPGRIVVLGQTSAIGASVESALRAFTTGPVTRVGGADRYLTAALLAQASYPDGASTAYLASGEVFADALSGGPSAILAHAPMLLTQGERLPAATLAALRALGVSKVVVLGGTDAVSQAVADAVGDALGGASAVTRIAGADRYATSVAIAEYTFPAIAAKPDCATVYLATGEKFADALTGGPVAAGVPGPVLLTPTSALDSGTGAEIEHYTTRRAVILGGTAAISDHTEQQTEDHLGK
jgi:putative cell wall-binding protein